MNPTTMTDRLLQEIIIELERLTQKETDPVKTDIYRILSQESSVLIGAVIDIEKLKNIVSKAQTLAAVFVFCSSALMMMLWNGFTTLSAMRDSTQANTLLIPRIETLLNNAIAESRARIDDNMEMIKQNRLECQQQIDELKALKVIQRSK